ncbi:MAG TPA: GNAT family N-acetyltransferase, partial [Gemmatimonadales bacterium]|nr:GNAT family N-acetyltransferase [Gemmatimonadales bacterium]
MSPDGPRIRPVTSEDAAAVAALSGQLGYPVAAEAIAARLERLLGRDDQLVLAAVADDGELAGWIHAAEQDLVEAERRCEILGLVVDGRRRRGGIGRG